MSTLRADNLTDGTNTAEMQNVIKGVAKAWVNFDGSGTGITIKNSLNVTSIVDNGTGNYTINFTTPFANLNYVTAFGSMYGTVNTTRQSALRHNGQTVSSLNVVYVYIPTNNGATLYDCPAAHVSAFGV